MKQFQSKRRNEKAEAFRAIVRGIAGMICGALFVGMAMATPNLTPGVFLSTVVPVMAIGAVFGFLIGHDA
jgi:hypothetical protein